MAIEVASLLEYLPKDMPYDTLRQGIIKRASKSEEIKLQDLFNNIELVDKTPSQLVYHL